MVFYNFKQDSLLNTPLARVINGTILGLLLLIWCSATFHSTNHETDGSFVMLVLAYVVASTAHSLRIVLSKNRWFEFDVEEAARKETFIITYGCLSSFFAIIIGVLIIELITSYQAGGQYYWYIMLIIYFIFNRVNICSLFNFSDSIYDLLPWYEANTKEEELKIIKHVLERDYDKRIYDKRED